MTKRNSTDLKYRMSGRWLSAFCALAPTLSEAVERLGDSVHCPIEGWPDAFRLFKDANETGGGVKHSLRVFPEGIDLLMWVNGWSFPRAYDELESWLGGGLARYEPALVKPKYVSKVKDETGIKNWLNAMWEEGLPLSNTFAYPARAYFSSRRILSAASSSRDIRFHPNLKYMDKQKNVLGTYGAILCKVRNNDGTPVQLHRTYILKDGRKVELPGKNKPKKATPSVSRDSKGRQVRLFSPKDGLLGVSEGLETALAVYEAKQFPVWPNLSNTNLHTLLTTKDVHTVLNFVDKDRSKAGENTAEILRFNLESKGIRVIDLLPSIPILESDEKGVDWADQLIRDPSGFDLIDTALETINTRSMAVSAYF